VKYSFGRKSKQLRFIWIIILLLIGAAAAGFWLHNRHTTTPMPAANSPVPKTLAQSVNFPIYYPDPKKLPAGYVLDSASFAKPVSQGIKYSVNYDKDQKMVFSLQPKPPAADLQNFNTNYIPLRIDYPTAVGQAEIGAYNNHGKTESLISLPTKTNTWIIITAPYNIDQAKLKQVISSLRR
jgi:hypothetical protein